MAAIEAQTARGMPAGRTPTSRGLLVRFSTGHVVMVVAALLAGLLNYGLLRAGDERVLVSTAATDLPAGHLLEPGDLATTKVAADDALLATLLRPAGLDAAVGAVTTGPLRAGDIIRTGDLGAPSGRGLRAMSLPIDPAHAAGGALEAGDVVDVVTVGDGRAAYALTQVEILTVQRAAGAGLAAGGGLTLTLAVDDADALRLAAAMATGELEVVRATGAPPANPPADSDASGSQVHP